MSTYYSYQGGSGLPLSESRAEKAQQAGWPVVTSNPTILAPVWPNFTMPTGVVGVAYSIQWDLKPAYSPTTYTVSSGTLPTGLTLTSPSGDLGVLSGTPTTAGTYTFTLEATNLYDPVFKTFTFLVVAALGGGGNFGWVA
jgi:hypothetical protein